MHVVVHVVAGLFTCREETLHAYMRKRAVIYMFLEGDSRAEIQRLDRWIEGLARVSIARKNGYEIKNLCYIQPLTGISATLLIDGWDDTAFRGYLAAKLTLGEPA